MREKGREPMSFPIQERCPSKEDKGGTWEVKGKKQKSFKNEKIWEPIGSPCSKKVFQVMEKKKD